MHHDRVYFKLFSQENANNFLVQARRSSKEPGELYDIESV